LNSNEIGYDDPPEWLSGFSVELVKKLDDLVRAYGVDDPATAVRRATLKNRRGVCVAAALSQHRAVMIGDQPGCVDVNRSYIRRFDGGGSYVVWQRGVTVEDVQELIDQLSILSQAFGPSVEQALGEMEPGDNQSECIFEVDVLFKSRRHLAIPFSGTDTVEEFAARFDRPEELAVVETMLGRGVCRKSDEAYMLQREEVVAIVLGEHGVTPDMVHRLAPGELAKVYRVVDMELDLVFDQK